MFATAATAGFRRPSVLPELALSPKVDLARDAVALDAPDRRLPSRIADGGISLDIKTTHRDDYGEPIEGWYASASEYATPFRMTREGFAAALCGAQQVAKKNEAVAVVQEADSGARYLVPLGVWNPADESEMSFFDVGGTPYYKGANDHVLLRNDSRADVEAVVFDDGAGWMNFTGHPVKLPTPPR